MKNPASPRTDIGAPEGDRDGNAAEDQDLTVMKMAILDDYQGVALASADWSALDGKVEITVFQDHLDHPAALAGRLHPFDIILVMRERTPLGRDLLRALPGLKLILSTGRRNASIDVTAAREQGITVCHTGYSSHGALEHSWALLLAAMRHIPAEVQSFRCGGWQQTVGIDLKGKLLGIVGLGNIGRGMARIATAFEMEVIAWSQNLTKDAAEAAGTRLVDKASLFREADIVTLHLILSGRSRGVVGEAELAQMKPGAWLINSSRGPLVDEAALITCLREKRIAGAALDVFDVEPLPADHPFRQLDTVLATSHIGFVTEETYRIFYQDSAENLLAWLAGRPIRVVE
jgi:phosphoglycerate dehydrogenase-like enzyme